jgi:hypothetical protein
MLPKAQTACSTKFVTGDERRFTSKGTAPALTTSIVWADVPEAMLVRAQADSNCIAGLKIKWDKYLIIKTYVLFLLAWYYPIYSRRRKNIHVGSCTVRN